MAGHVMVNTVPMVNGAALLLFCFKLMQVLTIANKRHRISTGQEDDGKIRDGGKGKWKTEIEDI